jgi:hypothetical protein
MTEAQNEIGIDQRCAGQAARAAEAARVIHRSEAYGAKLQDDFAVIRGLIDWLETRVDHEPERVRETLVRITASLRFHGRPPKKAGNKPRGLGLTLDEALIMVSLPDYENSIEKTARAHWQGLDEDRIDANIRRLYRHKKDLEDVGETF